MQNRRMISISLWITTVLWAVLIWSNSLKPGATSGDESRAILVAINDFLARISPSLQLSHLFVRKAAHFLEFAILGLLFSFDFYRLPLFWGERRRAAVCFLCVPCGALVALVDEGIQLFVEGRGASFIDVGLDVLGVIFAASCFALTVFLRRKFFCEKAFDK